MQPTLRVMPIVFGSSAALALLWKQQSLEPKGFLYLGIFYLILFFCSVVRQPPRKEQHLLLKLRLMDQARTPHILVIDTLIQRQWPDVAELMYSRRNKPYGRPPRRRKR
jgi:hypothetical protein